MRKKIFVYLAVFVSCLIMTSCVTAGGAEPSGSIVVRSSTSVEYYDYDNNYVVVYIDGIPSYRLWDTRFSRYYYRPVPRHRFGYIRHRHLSPVYHRNYMPKSSHHRPHIGRLSQSHHSNGHFSSGAQRFGGHSMNRNGGHNHHSHFSRRR